MKKALTLAVMVALGIYAVGWFKLSMFGAMHFIDSLEELALQGKAEEHCERVHDDLRVSIDDRSGPAPILIEGGKEQYCDYIAMAAKGMSLLGVATQFRRDDINVERSWLHPWTAQVRYYEERTTTMSRVNMTVRTESDDRYTLVMTLGGVKLLRLEARTTPATD